MTTPPPPQGRPGYPPPPGYPPYPQYPGYPPPYQVSPWTPPWKPGIIPLRPLTSGEIFSAAVGYLRANPMATLGLTAVIVTVTTLVELLLAVMGPGGAGGAALAAVLAAGATTAVATILLSGMLTVVVARAVLGRSITIGEAWRALRARLPALIALTVLEFLAVALLIGAVVLLIAGVARAANGGLAALIGIPLILLTIAAIAYLLTVLTFAPVVVVLERLPVTDSITRSMALVRRDFWRILGIRLLAGLAAGLVSTLVASPFGLVSAVLAAGQEAVHLTVAGAVIAAFGRAAAQIITAPFSAGVVVLLYADARMRSEGFGLVLQGAAAHGASGDDLWLMPPRS